MKIYRTEDYKTTACNKDKTHCCFTIISNYLLFFYVLCDYNYDNTRNIWPCYSIGGGHRLCIYPFHFTPQ